MLLQVELLASGPGLSADVLCFIAEKGNINFHQSKAQRTQYDAITNILPTFNLVMIKDPAYSLHCCKVVSSLVILYYIDTQH